MSATAMMTCPKCGAVQPAGDACRRCGLMRAHFVAAAQAADAERTPPDPLAAALWLAVEEAPEAQPRHDAFVNHCTQVNALPHAASRYRDLRTRLAEHPEAAAAAARMLTRIAKLAEVAMAQQAKVPRKTSRRIRLVFTLVLAVFFVAGVGLLLTMYRRQRRMVRPAATEDQLVIPRLVPKKAP
jgi:hypothetical protein